MKSDNHWIETYSGIKFHVFNPELEQISIDDISHSLSNLCRFSGHCKKFYSVAQHSVIVSKALPRPNAMWGLLHDAAEAYISDIARPVKYGLGPEIKEVEENILSFIAKKFDLQYPMPSIIHDVDNMALAAERRDLLKPGNVWPNLAKVEPLSQIIEPLTPEESKKLFIERYYDLRGIREAFGGVHG